MSDLKQWHRAVCSRYGYICQGCKKDFSFDHYFNEDGVNQFVCGHHIKTQKANPELVYEESNGVCVCFDCHTKIHKGLLTINIPTAKKITVAEDYPENAVPSRPLKNVKIGKMPELRYHTFPNGRKVALSHHEVVCKCGRYLALEATGKCMACEKRTPMFKAEKKPAKKK